MGLILLYISIYKPLFWAFKSIFLSPCFLFSLPLSLFPLFQQSSLFTSYFSLTHLFFLACILQNSKINFFSSTKALQCSLLKLQRSCILLRPQAHCLHDHHVHSSDIFLSLPLLRQNRYFPCTWWHQ